MTQPATDFLSVCFLEKEASMLLHMLQQSESFVRRLLERAINNWPKCDVQSTKQRIKSLNACEVMSSKNIGFGIDISFIHDRDLLVRSIPLHETENSVDSYCRPD